MGRFVGWLGPQKQVAAVIDVISSPFQAYGQYGPQAICLVLVGISVGGCVGCLTSTCTSTLYKGQGLFIDLEVGRTNQRMGAHLLEYLEMRLNDLSITSFYPFHLFSV